MEIDRGFIESAKSAERVVRTVARAIDIVLAPTSFTRIVMREEDKHFRESEWGKKVFGERYHPQSRARWIMPIAYTAAGFLETARLYGFYELGKYLLS